MSVKRVDLSGLNDEQREAVAKWLTDFQSVMPQVSEINAVAKEVFLSTLKAERWQIVEADQPDEQEELPEGWNPGTPEINFVDHIEGTD